MIIFNKIELLELRKLLESKRNKTPKKYTTQQQQQQQHYKQSATRGAGADNFDYVPSVDQDYGLSEEDPWIYSNSNKLVNVDAVTFYNIK